MSPELIPHPRALADELAGELATVLGGLAGATGCATAVPERVDPAWIVVARLDGSARGCLTLGFAEGDTSRLAQLVTGVAATPAEATIASALRDVSAMAFGALDQKPVTAGLTMSFSGAQLPGPHSPEGDGIAYRLTLGSEPSLTVGVWVRLERVSETGVSTASPLSGGGRQATSPGGESYPANIEVILDIDLPLSVRFGEAELTLYSLTRLGPGSVIDLGRSPDDPVDVLVNGRLVARGEVVVVAGNYGVRILEVVSAADRVRTLGA